METLPTQPPPAQTKISYRLLFITHFVALFTGAVIMYLCDKYIPF